LCTVFGIPIKVHVSLLVLFPLLALYFMPRGPEFREAFSMHPYLFTLLSLTGLFASVALHELGHSLVGIACGFHIREIVLLPIGGVARVDRMSERPRHEILVAAAGPATSIVLAVLLFLLGRFLHLAGLEGAGFLLGTLAAINIVLALFNLLPSFPMDGGRIFRACMTPHLGKVEATRRAARVGKTLFLVLGLFGLLRGSPLHMLIAFVLYRAAGAEYRMTLLQARAQQQPFPFSSWRLPPAETEPEPEIQVGPPPYAEIDQPDWLTRLKSWLKKE